ncbi:MAG: hypothetical protein ACRDTK_13260 [Mycobacterium sp.]
MTSLSVADIDRWNPGDVREVFHAARNRAEANHLASDGLATLPVFRTWRGAAGEAAKNSVEQTRKDLDSDGREALAVAMAADRAADGIEAVQAKLKALRADLEHAGLTIDPIANKVVASGAFKGTAAELAAKQGEFQPRLNAILGEATIVDEELARAIDMADGDTPIATRSPTRETVGPDGLTPDQVAVDAQQEQNQRDAFHQVYGRDPVSANDWRMACALDPHTYDPRYRGLESNVVVGRFKPVPGAGVYRQNMYIPAAEVQNFELDPTFQRILPHMAGDNRGPSSIVSPESARVTICADMEHGILVARQNPTMSTDGVEAGTGVPKVSALQGEDGSLEIFYNAADPFEPGIAKPFLNVSGHMVINPTGGGNLAAGGVVTQYPSTEAYQYKPDGTTTQLFNRQVTTDQLGAAWGLMLPEIPIGTVSHALYPNPSGAYLPPAPTDLGTAAQSPLITTVQLPALPPPLMTPVAAPPLPVPTPPPLPVPVPVP